MKSMYSDMPIAFFMILGVLKLFWFYCRFTLPPFLTLKNFEGLDLGKMDEVGSYLTFQNKDNI